MKPYKKLLGALVFSTCALLPKKSAWACGPMPTPPEEYRLSIFQPDIGDATNELAAYYFSLNRMYKADNESDFSTKIEVDQNYLEWEKELNTHFSKDDFSKATLDYNYQLIKDSAVYLSRSNSFIQAISTKEKGIYLDYFKLAKGSEAFNSVGISQDPWGLDNGNKTSVIILMHSLEKLLQQTNNKFIQQRTAYILCRLLFYGNYTVALKKVYNKYFGNASTNSWVKASAKYYYTRSENNKHTADYYKDLIDIIDHSKDKRMACIKLLKEDDINTVIPFLNTAHQRAIVIASGTLNYPAYSLNNIKKIYALDPQNLFIKLLITREINKLEDWLLTPVLTEYAMPSSKDNSFNDLPAYKKENFQKDIEYAALLKAFLLTIAQHNKENSLFLNICLGHVNFLLKDYAAAQTYCQKVLVNADTNSSIYLQAKVNSIIIALQQKQRMDDGLKENIYNLLTELDKGDAIYKNKKASYGYYNNNADLKGSLLVCLGRAALNMGDVVNASLLLSGTFKPWGTYTTGAAKSAYFLLYDHATDKDFDQLLAIFQKKNKSNYERYFWRVKSVFYGNYSAYPIETYNKEKQICFWDLNKILDLKGTYYLNKDSLEKALEAFKKIPNKFWKDPNNIYKDYLTGNPFNLNIYNTHNYNADSSYKNNPNKAVFVQKLIAYKGMALKENNPEIKSKLNYIIGNAYYSMTFYGTFWLMSKLWWERYVWDDDGSKLYSSFNENYYGTARAKMYYQKAIDLTNDHKKIAFYCIYLTNCENNKRNYKNYLTYSRHNARTYYNYPAYNNNTHIYAALLRRKGSENFYNRLIDECPLYSEFKSKIYIPQW